MAHGGRKPPRGHYSNLMTFHRIHDFRNTVREYELDIEGNRVLRYERTQYKSAPLGDFLVGSLFDGKPLENPESLAQDEEGRVYIREQSSRILQFDVAGNFHGVVPNGPNTKFVKQLVDVK